MYLAFHQALNPVSNLTATTLVALVPVALLAFSSLAPGLMKV